MILYMLVCGSAPFQEANDSETLTMIMDCNYIVSSNICHMISSPHCVMFAGTFTYFQTLSEPDQQHVV